VAPTNPTFLTVTVTGNAPPGAAKGFWGWTRTISSGKVEAFPAAWTAADASIRPRR